MPLTRAHAEQNIVSAYKKILPEVDYDVTTVGTNPDLNAPIARTLLQMGYAVVDLAAVADSDLAALTPSRYEHFLALAELNAGEALLGSLLALVDQQVGIQSEKSFSDIAKGLERRLTRKWAEYRRGFGAGAVAVGKMTDRTLPPDAIAAPWEFGT